jgi:hypothetical protein
MAGDFKNLPSSAGAEMAPLADDVQKIKASAPAVKSVEASVVAMTDPLAARHAELARARGALAASQARVKFLEGKLHARTVELAAVYASTSWRITAPMRNVSTATRWFARGSWAWMTFRPHSRPSRTVRSVLLRTLRYVLVRPNITRFLRRPLERFPLLKSVQRRMFNILLNVAPSADSFFSEREQFIHARLRAALRKRAD